jgi:hypothetical protein
MIHTAKSLIVPYNAHMVSRSKMSLELLGHVGWMSDSVLKICVRSEVLEPYEWKIVAMEIARRTRMGAEDA